MLPEPLPPRPKPSRSATEPLPPLNPLDDPLDEREPQLDRERLEEVRRPALWDVLVALFRLTPLRVAHRCLVELGLAFL